MSGNVDLRKSTSRIPSLAQPLSGGGGRVDSSRRPGSSQGDASTSGGANGLAAAASSFRSLAGGADDGSPSPLGARVGQQGSQRRGSSGGNSSASSTPASAQPPRPKTSSQTPAISTAGGAASPAPLATVGGSMYATPPGSNGALRRSFIPSPGSSMAAAAAAASVTSLAVLAPSSASRTPHSLSRQPSSGSLHGAASESALTGDLSGLPTAPQSPYGWAHPGPGSASHLLLHSGSLQQSPAPSILDSTSRRISASQHQLPSPGEGPGGAGGGSVAGGAWTATGGGAGATNTSNGKGGAASSSITVAVRLRPLRCGALSTPLGAGEGRARLARRGGGPQLWSGGRTNGTMLRGRREGKGLRSMTSIPGRPRGHAAVAPGAARSDKERGRGDHEAWSIDAQNNVCVWSNQRDANPAQALSGGGGGAGGAGRWVPPTRPHCTLAPRPLLTSRALPTPQQAHALPPACGALERLPSPHASNQHLSPPLPTPAHLRAGGCPSSTTTTCLARRRATWTCTPRWRARWWRRRCMASAAPSLPTASPAAARRTP